MTTYEVRREVDRFVLYFETPRHEINAYALASTLVALADAVREANAAVNPGYRVEVVVEALSDGSFRATVRTIFRKAQDLFAHEAAKAIVYGIISTYIYEKTLGGAEPPVVTVNESMVIIQSGDDRIIVPKDIYEAKKQLERVDKFKSAVGKVFDAAASDPNVTGLGFDDQPDRKVPPPTVPRSQFAIFQVDGTPDENTREIVEITQLEISRAILERGRRKWEFFWKGVKIAAPILDANFFTRFFAHEIKIAPGDALEVALRVTQEKNPDTGIFVNVRYEVLEVYGHVPRVKQTAF